MTPKEERPVEAAHRLDRQAAAEPGLSMPGLSAGLQRHIQKLIQHYALEGPRSERPYQAVAVAGWR